MIVPIHIQQCMLIEEHVSIKLHLSPRIIDSPRLLKIRWTGASFLCFPAPKSTHNSSKWLFKRANTETVSTNTSVSTLRMIILEWSFRDLSLTCKNTLVSASWWLQGEMKEEAIWFVLVMKIVPLAGIKIISSSVCDNTSLEIYTNNSGFFYPSVGSHANLLVQLNHPILCGVFFFLFLFLLILSNLDLCMYQILYLSFRKYIPARASLPEGRK